MDCGCKVNGNVVSDICDLHLRIARQISLEAVAVSVATEREACAKIAEDHGATSCQDFGMQDLMQRTAAGIAAAIRARGGS